MLLFRIGSHAFPELFSGCSVDELAEFMARAQPSCLLKPPASVQTVGAGPLCGNAMLDPGEQCDCGTVEVKPSAQAIGTGCNRLVIFLDLGKFKYILW